MRRRMFQIRIVRLNNHSQDKNLHDRSGCHRNRYGIIFRVAYETSFVPVTEVFIELNKPKEKGGNRFYQLILYRMIWGYY